MLPVAPRFAAELVATFDEKPAFCAALFAVAAVPAVLCEKLARMSADGALPVPADGALPPMADAGRESPS